MLDAAIGLSSLVVGLVSMQHCPKLAYQVTFVASQEVGPRDVTEKLDRWSKVKGIEESQSGHKKTSTLPHTAVCNTRQQPVESSDSGESAT